jgi:hypothetical protein
MPTFTLSARCSALPSSTDPDQHIAHILFVVQTIHYRLQSVKFCRTIVLISLELVIEPPADIIHIALQSLENATPQTIDFLDIAKFLRAELDNFPGLKTAMKDQVGRAWRGSGRNRGLRTVGTGSRNRNASFPLLLAILGYVAIPTSCSCYTQTPNHPVDTSQNGLWKVSSSGSGLTRLTVEGKGQSTNLNQYTQFPWSNVSRDGSMYAFETTNSGSVTYPYTFSLLYGSLSGGAPTTFASISDGTQLSIVGWTTM